VLLVVSLVSLVLFRLNPGIDFAAGSSLTIKFEKTVTLADVKQALSSVGYSSTVEFDAHGNVVIRTVDLTDAEKTTIESELTTQFGTLSELSFESVDPLVAKQTSRAAIIASVLASLRCGFRDGFVIGLYRYPRSLFSIG
jgi:preprotein translocase subunit SecF